LVVNRRLLVAAIVVMALAATMFGYAAFRDADSADDTIAPAWKEVAWPFPIDQWGTGKAFSCRGHDCGREVNLYLRVKLGSCNCTTGVADDDDLDRMSDFDLLRGEVSRLAPGRPIKVGIMNGRVRGYALKGSGRHVRNVMSVVVNDRCDMMVATAVLPRDRLEEIEPVVMEFLNSQTVLHWAEVNIGL
jgi:hypothetical protein